MKMIILSRFFLSGFIVFGLSLMSGCGLGIREVEDPRYSDGILKSEYRAFVTRGIYDGNLGGLTGADSICQIEANQNGLKRVYHAYLTDPTQGLSDRFPASDAAVYSLSTIGVMKIADHLSDMLGGFNRVERRENFKLRYDLKGKDVQSVHYWAGYIFDGTSGPADCEGWTTSSGAGMSRSNDHEGIIGDDCSHQINLVCISVSQ